MKDRYYVTIKCASNEEKMALGSSIHEQLVGNHDYIENNIILNVDYDNEVQLWIDDSCKEIPIINLDFNKK